MYAFYWKDPNFLLSLATEYILFLNRLNYTFLLPLQRYTFYPPQGVFVRLCLFFLEISTLGLNMRRPDQCHPQKQIHVLWAKYVKYITDQSEPKPTAWVPDTNKTWRLVDVFSILIELLHVHHQKLSIVLFPFAISKKLKNIPEVFIRFCNQ